MGLIRLTDAFGQINGATIDVTGFFRSATRYRYAKARIIALSNSVSLTATAKFYLQR